MTPACAFLAQRGVPINVPDADGVSPLDVAVLHEQPAAATSLRELRRRLDLRPREGASPLPAAAKPRRCLLLTPPLVDRPTTRA